MKNCAWFPDEEICRKKEIPEWIRRQRKIAKKVKGGFDAGCFTKRMLELECMITAGLKGVDPDKGPPKDQEESWLKKHPPLSAEYRENKRKNMLKVQQRT
jgi:hypothetical protein